MSASSGGQGQLPDNVAGASDFLLIHFNNTRVADIPSRISALKQLGKPIVCNEDDKVSAEILLTGGRSAIELSYAEQIQAASRAQLTNLIGRTTLKQLLAILQRASVVLCPDSGPAHMATAVGTPVVGLYATSNRFRTGPYASQHLVVDRYPQAVRAEFGVAVDALRWGRRVRNPDAMDLITVDDVKEKLDIAFAERDIKPQRIAEL